MLRVWTFDGRDHRVTCTLPVLQQISAAARDGFLSFRHGGMEIGGILVGSTRGAVTRIVDARPVTVSHARGAHFLLTDADHEAVAALVQSTAAEMAARGLQVVGCYESRTRRDAAPPEPDSEMFAEHFSAPGQVFLALKSEREAIATMFAYVRDENGDTIQATSVEDVVGRSSEEEAPVAPPSAVVAPMAAGASEPAPSREPLHATRMPAPESYDAPRLYVDPPPRARWKYAAGALALAACLGSFWMLRDRGNEPVPASARPVTPLTTPAAPAPSTPASSPTQPASVDASNSASAAAATTGRSRARAKAKSSRRVRQRANRTRRTTR